MVSTPIGARVVMTCGKRVHHSHARMWNLQRKNYNLVHPGHEILIFSYIILQHLMPYAVYGCAHDDKIVMQASRLLLLVLIVAVVLMVEPARASFNLSNTLGDGMVLQRDSASTVVWGFGAPGSKITTHVASNPPVNTIVGADGIWRQVSTISCAWV